MSIQIGDIAPRAQYLASAGQTGFTVPFPYYSETDLLVYKRADGSSPNDAVDLLAYPGNYTVSAPGLATGGTITLTVGATVNDIVTIIRDMPEARYSLYTAGGALSAEGLNADFSRDVMMNQQNELICKGLSPKYDNNAVISNPGDLLMDVLPAGYAWRKNAAGTKIEAFYPSSATPPVSDSATIISITQALHGLAVGDIVRPNGAGAYVESQADSAANAEVVGVVSAVADPNTFTLLMGGMITTGLVGLTPGAIQYLDPANAGEITEVRPTTAGQIVKPVIQAASATTGIWLNYLGVVI